MIGEEREDKMTEREVTPRFPTSGQIVGALVAKLGIKHSVLQSRNARRYFSADLEHLVKDSTREEIIGAIAEVLTDSGFIASPQGKGGQLRASIRVGLHATVACGSLGSVTVLHAPKDDERPAQQFAEGLGGLHKTCSHRSGSQVSRSPASCRVISGISGFTRF